MTVDVNQLAHDVAEMRTQLGGVVGATAEMRRVIARIADQVTALAGAEENTAPRWPDLSGTEREAEIAHLADWLDRYNPDGSAVDRALGRGGKTCWRHHDDVLNLLSALRCAWRGAYMDKKAPATAPLDYLTRWQPETCKLIESALRSCKGQHDAPALEAV